MKCRIILTAQEGVDSKAEIKKELSVIEEITGTKPLAGENRSAVFEFEFHNFYLRVKERITRKLKAYD